MYSNKVMIIGRVVTAPEFRQISASQSLTKIRVAANTNRRDKQPIRPLYIDCIMYNRTLPSNHRFHVGALVFVEGQLEIAEWQVNGQKCSKPQVKLAPDSPMFLAENPRKKGSGQNLETSLRPQSITSENGMEEPHNGTSVTLVAACPYESSIVCPKSQRSIEQGNLNPECPKQLTAEASDNEYKKCKDTGRTKEKKQPCGNRRKKK